MRTGAAGCRPLRRRLLLKCVPVDQAQRNKEVLRRRNPTAMPNLATLKPNPPAQRLRGSLPKIGIRPTIDGRYGGARES